MITAAEPWKFAFMSASIPQGVEGIWLRYRVRVADGSWREELSTRGFKFREDLRAKLLLRVFDEAEKILRLIPSLETVCDTWVKEIVVLKAKTGYDVSHSEPRWPHTIFISVPTSPSQVNALRTIENVVHEAMHLQLTAVENQIPLIADEQDRIFSPWKAKPRPLRGVLHGFYVFRCLASFFAAIELLDVLDCSGRKYVLGRQKQIWEEIGKIDMERLSQGMTVAGFEQFSEILGFPADLHVPAS